MEHYTQLLSLEVPCTPDAPGKVREALSQAEPSSWQIGDVLLVASELTTNAVLHSGCTETHTIHISAEAGPDSIVISVRDPGLSNRRAQPPGTHESWGLRIVDQLAERWGAERDDGYRVWAEIPLAPPSEGAPDSRQSVPR